MFVHVTNCMEGPPPMEKRMKALPVYPHFHCFRHLMCGKPLGGDRREIAYCIHGIACL